MPSELDKEKLKERQTVRLKVLKAVFDDTVLVGKDIRTTLFSAASVAPELQLDANDIYAALQYLNDEGLVEFVGARGGALDWVYKLTHDGLLEVEQAIEHPDQRTEHFMLSVVQHFHAAVGSVQTGPDATANVKQRTE